MPLQDISPDIPDLINQFAAGPRELRQAVTGMTPQQIHARPVPGQWSTLEVVCHLVDFDIVYASRLQRALAEDNPQVLGADPDQFAAGLKYSERDLEEELQLLESLRRQVTRLFRLIPEAGWQRRWTHSSDGTLPLHELLRRIAGHLPHHVTFILEKRQALGLDQPSSGKPSHDHLATIDWSLGNQPGSAFRTGQYSREHRWTFDGGVSVPASPSPLVVPQPWSNPGYVDPEEAFVASVASCHMLTFLSLTAKAGFVVKEYHDVARGVMTKNERRVPWVSEVTLSPKISWGEERLPSAEEIAALHEEAHKLCFIANSVKTRIHVLP